MRVWNMRDPRRPKLQREGGTAVYIGRPGPWGNPFTIGQHGNRQQVISLYKQWLSTQKLDLEQLRGKDLVCWCAPQACHGDILLQLANTERTQS